LTVLLLVVFVSLSGQRQILGRLRMFTSGALLSAVRKNLRLATAREARIELALVLPDELPAEFVGAKTSSSTEE
jgi:hypothetical protein